MAINTSSSPHFHGPNTVSKVMMRVVYALIPGVAIYAWLFGWGILVNLVLASATALAAESIMLAVRKRPQAMYLTDGSALLTGLLLGVALPPLAPWWLVVTGTAFAIVFAKHLYGGLGYNPFNPAMIGYVMLLISFPLEMTTWPAPLHPGPADLNLSQVMGYVFGGVHPLDALTSATPLDTLKTQLGLKHQVDEIISGGEIFGHMGGKGWEWVNLGFLVGGLWLIYKRVISWHVPVALLGTLLIISLVFHLINPGHYAAPLFHLFSGAAILGAFFIATDPVSGCTTLNGRIAFGMGVGILTYIIRTWGGYPDAIAFSVLLMNMAAPTIDYYTQPRVFGK